MNSSNEELSSEFLTEMYDVTPIKADNNKTITLVKPSITLAQRLKREALQREIIIDDSGFSTDQVKPVAPLDFIGFKKDGVQQGVYKNLRLGKYAIDSTLHLQHLSFIKAREALYLNLKECHELGIRTLLVKHGVGLKSKPFAAFLKSYVNQWLRQSDKVIAFHTALKQHGGVGAVYVLLKKNAQQKLINRERNRKG